MPLTEKQKEQLEKLDLTMGGGFYNFATNVNRADMLDDKFLFVGLGGKGSKAVTAIKTGIAKKVKIEEGKDKPDNVEFLAIDTDKKELDNLATKKMESVGLDGNLETCQLFSSDAAKALDKDLIPDYIKSWKNPRLHAHLDGNGANGIRQASRFLLSYSDGFDEVKRRLEAKLTHLNGLNGGKLLVYLLAGISGGTGSGTFIDIAYIIRQICENNGYEVKVEGYIFLPDSYPVKANSAYLRYNAYAAMKELDFYMNIKDRANTFFDATYADGFTVHSHENIFNTCTLITGSIQGKGRVPKPDKFSQQVVVDHVVNLITKSELGDDFLIESFLDNDQAMIADCVKNKMPNTVPKDALFQYNVIGIGAVTLPIEQIMSYIAKKSFDNIVSVWSNEPQPAHVDRLIQTLRVYPSVQFNDILAVNRVELLRYQKKMLAPNKQDVINGTAFAQVKQLWMARNVELGISLDAACNEVLTRIINAFSHELQAMFEDPDRGLFYTVDFLGHVAANEGEINGLLQRLKTDVYNEANGLIGGARATQANYKTQMRAIENDLGRSVFPEMMLRGKIEEYLEYAVGYWLEESKIDIYERIQSKLDELIAHVEKKLGTYQRYADSFWGIKDVFESNFNCVMAGSIEANEYQVNLVDLSRKDQDTKQFKEYLDNLLEEGNYRSMVVHLAKKIEDNAKLLLIDEDYNPMRVYTQFIEEEFSEIPNATIEKIIKIKYGNGGFSKGVTNIFNELSSSARVIFDPLAGFPLNNMSSIGYISAPKAATDLVEQIRSCANAKGIKVAESTDMNSIIWYNLICGVPLFAVNKIMDYEKEYENAAQPLGRHLSETGERDWGKFPNLFKEQLWKNFAYSNAREKALIDEVNTNTDKMLEWGIIVEEEGVGGAQEYVGRCLVRDVTEKDIEDFMAEYSSDAFNKDENGLKTGAHMFDKFFEYIGMETEEIYIPIIYEDKNLEGLKRMLRQNWLVYLDLKKMLEVYPKLEAGIGSKNKLRIFNDLMVANRIWDDDGFWIYNASTGKEVELLNVERMAALERDYELYYLFDKFQNAVSDDEIEDVMPDVDEILNSRSERAALRERRENTKTACEDKLAVLNQARTQRQFESAKQGKLYTQLVEFYTDLKNLN